MNDFRKVLTELEERFSIRIDYREKVTSTNDMAAQPIYGHGDVIWAENQTKGRGQRGNHWESARGQNLTFSIILKPNEFPAEHQFYLSKIISIALVGALAGLGIIATVKWPNDIYVGDRKMAGILIENDLMGALITKSIAGIGLNVNQQQFDPGLPNPVSMAIAADRSFDRTLVLEHFLHHLFCWFNRMDRGDFRVIDQAYLVNLYRKSGQHWYAEPDSLPFLASIETVYPTGELLLLHANGLRKCYLFKEVEFIMK